MMTTIDELVAYCGIGPGRSRKVGGVVQILLSFLRQNDISIPYETHHTFINLAKKLHGNEEDTEKKNERSQILKLLTSYKNPASS